MGSKLDNLQKAMDEWQEEQRSEALAKFNVQLNEVIKQGAIKVGK